MQDGKLGTETPATSSSVNSMAASSWQRWWELSSPGAARDTATPDKQLDLYFEIMTVYAFPVMSDTCHSTGHPVSKQVLLSKQGPYLLLAPKEKKRVRLNAEVLQWCQDRAVAHLQPTPSQSMDEKLLCM